MLKIGEFSKLSMLTVRALRFHEREGLLAPAHVNERTGYRIYDTAQLRTPPVSRRFANRAYRLPRSRRFSVVRTSRRSSWNRRGI